MDFSGEKSWKDYFCSMLPRKLKAFFRRPHPFLFGPWSLLVPGLATFVLIALLAPFGFRELSLAQRLIWAVGLGVLVAGSVGGVVKCLQWGKPGWMEAEKWTLGKEIALVATVMGVIAFGVSLLLWGRGMGKASPGEFFLEVAWRTVSIGFFPLTLLVLLEQYIHQRKVLHKAQELSQQLEMGPGPIREIQHVLEAENGKPALQLHLADLVYLQSAGNYVEVHHRDGSGRIHKDLVRNRLKALAAELPPESFFQCHKSYVVNVQHIRKVKGNARNYTLELQFDSMEIPVARSRSAELSGFLGSPLKQA